MRILSKRPARARLLALALVATSAFATLAAASDLSDIVARIDYGFYTGDARMIDAARSELARAGSATGADAYYAAYAAYRLSRLDGTASVRERRALVTACLEAARRSAEHAEWAAEAQILIAACALQGIALASTRAHGHEARVSEALTAARSLDADNPRLLLIESRHQPDELDAEAQRERRRALLERAREAFDMRNSAEVPDWGRAELLASLGEIYLELGQRREARDFIEQALIEAPDYDFALELRKALSYRP